MPYNKIRSNSEYASNQIPLEATSFSKLQVLVQLEAEVINIIGRKNISIDPQDDIFTRIQHIYISHLQATAMGLYLLEESLKVIGKVNAPVRVKLLYFKAHQLFIKGDNLTQVQSLIRQAFYCNQTNFNKLQIGFRCGLLFCQLTPHLLEIQNTISNLIVSIQQQLELKHRIQVNKPAKEFRNKIQQTKFIYIGSREKGTQKVSIDQSNRINKLALYQCLFQCYFTAAFFTKSQTKKNYYHFCQQELHSKIVRDFPGININKKLYSISSSHFYSLNQFSQPLKSKKIKEENPSFGKTMPINFHIRKNSESTYLQRRLSHNNFRKGHKKNHNQSQYKARIYKKSNDREKQNQFLAKHYIERVKKQIKRDIGRQQLKMEQKNEKIRQEQESNLFKQQQNNNKDIVLRFDRLSEKPQKVEFKKKKIQLKINFTCKPQKENTVEQQLSKERPHQQITPPPSQTIMQASTQTQEQAPPIPYIKLKNNKMVTFMPKKGPESNEAIDLMIKQELQLISVKDNSCDHGQLKSQGAMSQISEYQEQFHQQVSMVKQEFSKTRIIDPYKQQDYYTSVSIKQEKLQDILLNNDKLSKSQIEEECQMSQQCFKSKIDETCLRSRIDEESLKIKVEEEFLKRKIVRQSFTLNQHIKSQIDIYLQKLSTDIIEILSQSPPTPIKMVRLQSQSLNQEKQQNYQYIQQKKDKDQPEIAIKLAEASHHSTQINQQNPSICNQILLNRQSMVYFAYSALIDEEISAWLSKNTQQIITSYTELLMVQPQDEKDEEMVAASPFFKIDRVEQNDEELNDDENDADQFDHKDLSSEMTSFDKELLEQLQFIEFPDKNEEKMSEIGSHYLPYSKIQIKKDSSAEDNSHINFVQRLFKNENISQIRPTNQAGKNYENKFSEVNSVDFSRPTETNNFTSKNMVYIRKQSLSNHFDIQDEKVSRNKKRQKTHNFCNKYNENQEEENVFLKEFDHWLKPSLRIVNNCLVLKLQYKESLYQRYIVKAQQIINKDKLCNNIVYSIESFLQSYTYQEQMTGQTLDIKKEIFLSQNQWIQIQNSIELIELIPEVEVVKEISIFHQGENVSLRFVINHRLNHIVLQGPSKIKLNPIHVYINQSIQRILEMITQKNIIIQDQELFIKGIWTFLGPKNIKLRQKSSAFVKCYVFGIYECLEENCTFSYTISEQDEQKQMQIKQVSELQRKKIWANIQIIIGYSIKIIKGKIAFNATRINDFLKIL